MKENDLASRYDFCNSPYFDGKYDQTKVCSVYDRYKRGEISKADWTIYICTYLKNYIFNSLKWCKNYIEYNDIMQEACLSVIEKIDNYDPYIYTVTTYFDCYIREGVGLKLSPGVPNYYKKTSSKLDKIVKAAGYEGLLDESIDIIWLSMVSELSIKTIKETIRMNGYTKNSFEVLAESGVEITSDVFATPETHYAELEQREAMQDLLTELTPLERYLVDVLVMNPHNPIEDEPGYDEEKEAECERKRAKQKVKDHSAPSSELKAPSFKTLTRLFNSYEKLRGKYKDELPEKIDSKFFELTHKKALRKLKSLLAVKKYTVSDDGIHKSVRQAEDDDVLNALDLDEI